ncbi:MAG: signal peptidase I [Oscillospiraceae bacterium]|nr:signal peptidase I [Oscillospiraceae bacterium]
MSTRKKTKAEEKAEREALSPGERVRRELYDWIQSLMVALIFCVILFSFVLRLINVSGPSMNPTLYDGNKMLVSDLFYKPKAGDIVVFKNVGENKEEKALVKRVVATEGQEVNIDFEHGLVYVDGQPLEEDYVAEPIRNKLDFIGPKTVPEGCVFVLGDNRNSSRDSRASSIGMVDERLIIGKVYAVVYPLDAIKWVK